MVSLSPSPFATFVHIFVVTAKRVIIMIMIIIIVETQSPTTCWIWRRPLRHFLFLSISKSRLQLLICSRLGFAALNVLLLDLTLS
jgi:hypothetical protein